MDSKEITPNPETSTADAAIEQPEEVDEIDIDGEKVTLDDIREWKKWNLRQADYTRKTQELAREREEIERLKQPQTPANDEAEAADQFLQSKDYVKKDFVEKQIASMKQEQQLDKFFDSNPDLAPYETAIRDLAIQKWKAPEDIVVEYKFSTSDKLKKARSSRVIVGNSEKEAPKEKSISEMTPGEFAEFRKKNTKRGSFA